MYGKTNTARHKIANNPRAICLGSSKYCVLASYNQTTLRISFEAE
jgi:hypothetical protein